MRYAIICEEVEKLHRQFDRFDVYDVCREKGILVLPYSFGTAPDAIKGFCKELNRIVTITVNSDLPEVIQRIIVAHELGHAVLHRKHRVLAFHDVAMFDQASQLEKDANLFAAEFLLPDADVLACLNSDATFFSAASALNVPLELLDFKVRLMKWRGYQFADSPMMARSNFLRDVRFPDSKKVDYS